jgi:AcrR family transcriptional regulator
MSPNDAQPGPFRAPGIARRRRLLAAARRLLGQRDLDELSLADVARAAGIPKGSAYHYYGNIMQLYVQLLAVIDEEMLADVRGPLRGREPESWADVVAQLVRRGARFFERDRAARQLLISAKTPPELKLRDRQSDVRIGKLFEQHIAAHFVLPAHRERERLFFRAVEIADLMFSLSVLEHGRITAEMTEEAIRAVVGYLRAHFAVQLPRRRAATAARHDAMRHDARTAKGRRRT